MKNKPNIIVIKTDQQRSDTIAALGNSHMITPNMDRLASESVSFTNAFCCGATCVSSRAAFYTGLYPHNTGVYGFNNWSHIRTWLHDLKDGGYHLSAVGKVHHQPMDEYMAYDERVYAENFPEYRDYDDFSNYLKAEGQPNPNELLTADGKWLEKCCSAPYPLEEKYFVDNWVGRMASRWIDDYEGDKPFFLHVGFVGPHDPFAPPQRFIDMYKDVDIPDPLVSGDDFETKPPQFKRFMEQCINAERLKQGPVYGIYNCRLDDKEAEDIRNMRRHYYARVTAIDEQIGFIMDKLESKGLLENSIIVFTSDHGDNLGDHRMVYKWLMTEQSTKVPILIRLPQAQRKAVDDGLFTQMDIGPTLLEFAGLNVPCYLDGRSNLKRITEGDSSQVPEKVYCEDNYLTMVRAADKKMVYYSSQPYGEYYDLENDPSEFHNLYHCPDHSKEITVMKLDLLDWITSSSYLGSAMSVGMGPAPKRHWPAYTPQDPYILSGAPRMDRIKIK